MRIRGLLAVLVTMGCGTDPADAPPDAVADAPADAAPDLSGPLFDPNHIVDVSITLPEADWDTLRRQTRPPSDVFGSCPTGPHSSPFTRFHATVTIDGIALPNVAVRKKGFYGSLDEDKPSLKLKTDEYVRGQAIYGLTSITLNNAKQDPSLIRQCLAYWVFAKAGVPASRCNFARVTVNGRPLGIYVNVEPVNKTMIRRHFSDPEGNLYEGALSDFRTTWLPTFDKKTNESDPDRSDLAAVATAAAAPDAQLEAALASLVDLDELYTYWATEVLIGHTDSYSGLANNFLVYRDPNSGRFSFLPWGVDNTFHDGGVINQTNAAVAANGILTRRLYLHAPTRDRYLARLTQLLTSIWNESELLAEIDRMAALVSAPPLTVEEVRSFVRGRRAAITDALSAGPPAWTAPFKASSKPCFETNGSTSGVFQTTWGTLGNSDVFASGSGTLTGTVESLALANATQVGAASGQEAGGPAVIHLYGSNPNQTVTIVVFSVSPSGFAPGDISVGFGSPGSGVYLYTPGAGTVELLGLVSEGTVHLDTAAMTANASVRGSFSVSTLRLPF